MPYEKVTGKQVNMISQSWDGKRVYITSSLLANWDKGGSDNEQFLRGFTWNGKELKQVFEVDFTKEQLGRARGWVRGEVERVFADELAGAPRDTASAVELALSFEAWDQLRAGQGISPLRATAVVTRTVAALLGPAV